MDPNIEVLNHFAEKESKVNIIDPPKGRKKAVPKVKLVPFSSPDYVPKNPRKRKDAPFPGTKIPLETVDNCVTQLTDTCFGEICGAGTGGSNVKPKQTRKRKAPDTELKTPRPKKAKLTTNDSIETGSEEGLAVSVETISKLQEEIRQQQFMLVQMDKRIIKMELEQEEMQNLKDLKGLYNPLTSRNIFGGQLPTFK